MKKKLDRRREDVNVEFGMEFGDPNAGKFFEIPFMNEGKSKKEGKKRD